jgi:hypothetical protein
MEDAQLFCGQARAVPYDVARSEGYPGRGGYPTGHRTRRMPPWVGFLASYRAYVARTIESGNAPFRAPSVRRKRPLSRTVGALEAEDAAVGGGGVVDARGGAVVALLPLGIKHYYLYNNV